MKPALCGDMRNRCLQTALILLWLPVAAPSLAAAGPDACGDLFSYQVLLDGHGFSPGQIDGKPGNNTTRAIQAFQESAMLPATGRPDCETWKALEGDSRPPTTTYVVTEADVAGPFVPDIPAEL